MTGTHLIKNDSGTTLKVNFDALDNIISEFSSNISELVQSKEYVVTNIIELEGQFSTDTFVGIKEKLSSLNSDINKIAESLSTFNDSIKQAKISYERMAELYMDASVNENKSKSENTSDVDSKTTIKTFENIELKYDEAYNVVDDYLTRSKGVVPDFNGHRETWYSEKVLPGEGLNIPGRHVASDGTIRDIDGYIVVASDLNYMPRGTTLMTSLGPAKVYDTGCAYGTIDIYTNWE